MNNQRRLLIGELSNRIRIFTQTIRYYERLGLLNLAERNTVNYCIY